MFFFLFIYFYWFMICDYLPAHLKEKKEALGEVLNGDRLVSAPYVLEFQRDKESVSVCNTKLSKEDVARFRSAVRKDYYFQMYYDDLPIWGFIGKVDKEGKDPIEYRYFLYKHIHFDVFYNKDRVIEINVRTDPNALVDLTEDAEVNAEFLYTVKWKETNTAFEKRMDKYSQSSSLPHHLEIHWFSIINSCVTVLLLTGFLTTILMRVLKNDFVKYVILVLSVCRGFKLQSHFCHDICYCVKRKTNCGQMRLQLWLQFCCNSCRLQLLYSFVRLDIAGKCGQIVGSVAFGDIVDSATTIAVTVLLWRCLILWDIADEFCHNCYCNLVAVLDIVDTIVVMETKKTFAWLELWCWTIF